MGLMSDNGTLYAQDLIKIATKTTETLTMEAYGSRQFWMLPDPISGYKCIGSCGIYESGMIVPGFVSLTPDENGYFNGWVKNDTGGQNSGTVTVSFLYRKN